MKTENNKESEFAAKVIEGLKLVSERLIQTKIEKGQSVVIMREGKIVKIKASELKSKIK